MNHWHSYSPLNMMSNSTINTVTLSTLVIWKARRDKCRIVYLYISFINELEKYHFLLNHYQIAFKHGRVSFLTSESVNAQTAFQKWIIFFFKFVLAHKSILKKFKYIVIKIRHKYFFHVLTKFMSANCIKMLFYF